MEHKIKKVYVIHHSHTDIGYTDLQERVIDNQKDYIHTVLEMMKKPEYQSFRWNCETFFCIEEFLKTAQPEEKEQFYRLVKQGKIGVSANYLNFNDLLDCEVYADRLQAWKTELNHYGVELKTAMFADINGVSMGYRDAMIQNGVEFLYANVHCHHGMYPLRQNQTAFWWENREGKRLLVWNGEHYNLGNALGIKPNRTTSYMQRVYFGEKQPEDPVQILHNNLTDYLTRCEEDGYAYPFIITSVSGVFSDNAPPSLEILEMIEQFNQRYGEEVELCMVSLQELYGEIRDLLADAPVYRGDFTDWWANGVGSTPYAVKHYLEAKHKYHLCERLEKDAAEKYEKYWRMAQDNLLLYAEHTWGHSSTITNPYDTMVLNLDMRKNSYASKAHEAASYVLNQIAKEKGDSLRYYNTNGKIKVCNLSKLEEPQLVEFYIETLKLDAAQIVDQNGKEILCQVSSHPRGRKISFVDTFAPGEEKIYEYRELELAPELFNTRKCYIGSEKIRDIVNDYDPESYHLPYYFENQFFRLEYRSGEGIKTLVDKRTGRDLSGENQIPLFTPIYEVTRVRRDKADRNESSCPEEYERRIVGRNIRGWHAQLHVGKLEDVICQERGPVFTVLRFQYALPGTVHADVIVKLFAQIPRIDFRLELGKTISSDVESIFLPLGLRLDHSSLYLRKGTEAFRPGTDQIPGTCMEFYMSDDGLAYTAPEGGAMVAMRDTPLLYLGELKAHPIRLCEGKEEDNCRPVYSWVMNNIWETNFKMDLSGFCEFTYSLWLHEEEDPEKAMDQLRERTYDPYVFIVE